MPDRLESAWIDVLAGRTDAAEAARLTEALAGDPVAAHAFEGWRRLAAVVCDDAAARAIGLPPLDGVLAAIQTPAGQPYGSDPFSGPTALDRMGRATLGRLSAAPLVAAGAPHPVPAWVIGAAAIAAGVVLALWPTPHGPLGGVFVAALRERAAQPQVAASIDPTPIGRLANGAELVRRGDASNADGPLALAGEPGGDPAGPGRTALSSDDFLDDASLWLPDTDMFSGSRPVGGTRTGRTRAPRAPRPGTGGTVGAIASARAAAVTDLPTGDPSGYPPPGSSAAAYPPPLPPVASNRGGGGKSPSKPPRKPTVEPTDAPTDEPTAPPPSELPPTNPPPTEPPATATPPAPTDLTVVGTVVGADGGGRAQVRIAAYRAGDTPIGSSWVETFTADATGRYTLTLQPGDWQFYAEAPGHRPQWAVGADRPEAARVITLFIGPTIGIHWQLAPSGDGDGLVVGEAGPHAWVRAVPEGADPTRSAGPSALADAAGRFALPLPAGRWAIARAGDGRDRDWQALPEAVTVEVGTSTTVAWP